MTSSQILLSPLENNGQPTYLTNLGKKKTLTLTLGALITNPGFVKFEYRGFAFQFGSFFFLKTENLVKFA
jgi:hypothetical protein